MVISAYEDRVRRGRWLHSHGHVYPDRKGQFDVQSQRTIALYHVQVVIEDAEIVAVHCECPDCIKMQFAIDEIIDSGGTRFHPGISHLNGDALCKHGIACLIQMGVMTLEDVV